jgi:glutathione synthase/RimK-type ligase-like ATP-grasp enzyme
MSSIQTHPSSSQATYRLAIATCEPIPDIHPDDAHLVQSLRRLGVEPIACVWSDPAIDWPSFDAVLIRATWDYFKRYAEFRQWLDRLPVPTINDRELLRWNSDKRYLLDLERQGVEIIPMQVCAGADLDDTLATMPSRAVVVKPTVSGGAWHTVRGTVGEAGFQAEVAALPRALDYLVQPFVPEVVEHGEWSLLFFDGAYSHAVLKRAARGDYRVQGSFGGSTAFIEPAASTLATARRVLAATAALGHADQAYARVDGVVVDGRFLLMELEMVEPLLFLAERPDAAERLAGHVCRRLASLKDSSWRGLATAT